jgi:dihydrolipoamide dehydrogenase
LKKPAGLAIVFLSFLGKPCEIDGLGETDMSIKKDIAVIGAGSGGYVAALRAARLGKNVVLFEEDRIGGTCINYGCIPTKYLLHQTKLFKELKTNQKWDGPVDQILCNWSRVQAGKLKAVDRLVRGIEFLLEKNGVEFVPGKAALQDERHVLAQTSSGEKVFEVERIILAMGSHSADLPILGADGRAVVTSRETLDFADIPKKLLVVGAGAIGLEMGTIFSRLGTDVTVLEIMPTVLPGCDKEMGTRLERVLKMQGLKIFTQMRIEQVLRGENKAVLKGTCLRNMTPFEFSGDRVLLAAGRKANSQGLPRDSLFIKLDPSGWVEVNSKLETNIPGIYAIGDLVGGKLLAHKASHEGLIAAENAAGGNALMDYRALPMAVFTEPEFASVGLTEEEARQKDGQVRIGVFSFQASGRALTMESPEGQVKIIAGKNDEILGAHILGPSASELIAELVLAMDKKLKLNDVASAIHIHPTLSESVMEAAMKAQGMAIHVLN